MLQTFRCAQTEALFNGRRVARFVNIEAVALRKLQQLHAATALEFLRIPPGNRLEALKGTTMTREVPLIHPGVILLEDWLKPLGLSQYALAKAIGVPPRRINEIVKGLRGITPDTALRLAAFFGTDAQSWLNLQGHYDTEKARAAMADALARIAKHEPAHA